VTKNADVFAFQYPAKGLNRIHGPRGYKSYKRYRPWLRDEFAFRCVYCLVREQWIGGTKYFDLDHVVPRKSAPERNTKYDNLVYACRHCNVLKSGVSVPDPLGITAQDLRVHPDGKIEPLSPKAKELVEKLQLNVPERVEYRLVCMRNSNLARKHDSQHFQILMGYPAKLPNLALLRPPDGNSRPEGLSASHFARKVRGELPRTY
jgi:hypothetical protein